MSDHVQAVTHDLLVRELGQVPQWDILGIYLGLNESEIQVIERDHHDTARRRLAMLSKWMEKDIDASWEKVIEALKNMSQIRLANQLKEKYCASESNPSDVEAAGRPAESSLEKELMVDRHEVIVREIEELEEKFLLLVTSVHSAMAEANLSLIKLKMFSKFYTKNKVSTVEELFDLLEPYYFLDYTLLEKIVKFFLSKDTVADDLLNYLHQLARFKTSTTIKQFMEGIEQAQRTHDTAERPGLCTVKLRLIGGWLDKTMEDLEKLVNEMFQDKRYVLTHLKIVRGSIIVTFSAPLSEADSLTLVAREQSSFAHKVGVSLLVVADTVITQSDESLDFSFESSLLGAIEDNDTNILSFLLSIHTNPDAADADGQTALMYGIQFGNDIKVVTLLLKANADLNLPDKDGRTPLYIASRDGHTEITSLLLKANADPNLCHSNGITPLWIASQNGHTEIISLLLKANADPNLCHSNGITPLWIASQNGHTEIISLLLKANADPNLCRSSGTTPLYMASQNFHTEIISLLLKGNADPNLQHSNGTTPLWVASHNGHTKIITLLLKANADPNLQRTNGTTPLWVASQKGHTEIISLLLKANADPNLQRTSGSTPLWIASQEGHSDVISLLLKANADLNLQGNGVTPLYMASRNGHTEAVSQLLKANADINLGSRVTPLIGAAARNHTQIVQLLLDSGADPNVKSSSGITALMSASHAGHLKSVQLLLKFDADPSIKGQEGLTALEMAATAGHEDIVQLLQSKHSTTSPVLTANEIASNVDNEAMALINRAMEQLLVEKTETLITTEYQKFKKTTLPLKEYGEDSPNIFLQ